MNALRRRFHGSPGLHPYALAAWLVLALGAAPGCLADRHAVRGNGVLLSEQREAPPQPFDAVSVDAAIDVRITVDPSAADTRIEISGDENILPLITSDVRRGTLVLASEAPYLTRRDVQAEIVTQSLHGVRMLGAAEVRASGIDSPLFVGLVSGSGNLRLDGRAAAVEVAVSGSGSVDGAHLKAGSAQVRITGSGDVEVFARDRASLSISGSGDIRCLGGPRDVRRSVTGSGSIRVP